MTQDEIIRMAREAGCYQEEDGCGTYMVLPESSWETFANLIAEATKAKAKQSCQDVIDSGMFDGHQCYAAAACRNAMEKL